MRTWLPCLCMLAGCASWRSWVDRSPPPEAPPPRADAARLRIDARAVTREHWAIDVDNASDEPLSFAHARVSLLDARGAEVPLSSAASTLLGPSVEIAPHGRWSGALVLARPATEDLELRWSGARLGPGPSTSVDITLPAGCATSAAETAGTLPGSSHVGRRAEKLRTLGDFFIGAGVAGTVAITAALGVSDHSRYAAAGTGMLGVAAVGGLLEYIGWRHARRAAREYAHLRARAAPCPDRPTAAAP